MYDEARAGAYGGVMYDEARAGAYGGVMYDETPAGASPPGASRGQLWGTIPPTISGRQNACSCTVSTCFHVTQLVAHRVAWHRLDSAFPFGYLKHARAAVMLWREKATSPPPK